MNKKYYQLSSDLTICRIVNGMWQVAGGHGQIDHELAMADMLRYHDAGFTTWDLADIYGPAEDFIGEFRRRLSKAKGKEELDKIQSFTKWVPQPSRITRSMVNSSIETSIRRMDVSSLDLLQFHWWDYNNPYYMDALKYLSELRDKGSIKHLGLTNFDTDHLQIITDSGVPIASNQVQYSIIDRRPEVKMIPFCRKHNISLLTYGSICGGLLSERYVGKTEPSITDLNTLSLQKYKKMIDTWGNWNLFQKLLLVLDNIAKKHRASIANVATNYILSKATVAGVIIGVRLGIIDHIDDNSNVFSFNLDDSDLESINQVCENANNLYEIIGDCGEEYR
ncbi:MAG TPA: aldo/keto reductase [Nitrososphaeraceae archaeon]|jgi:aryl-alcohol dehydrogenase-like predicted oxidoreductase|nr:aldo/keto reductase [Nitrososphaeraceae archaeon]